MDFSEKKEKNTISKKTFIIFLIILLVLVIWSSICLRQCAHERSIAIPIEATVTDIRYNQEDTGLYYKIYLSYSYDNHNVQNEYWDEVSDLTWTIGDKMVINIVPEHPIRIYKEVYAMVFYAVFGIILSLLLAIFIDIPYVNSEDIINTLNEKKYMMIIGSRICVSLGYMFLLGCFFITKLPLRGFLVPGIILAVTGMLLFMIIFFKMKELKKRNVNGLFLCLIVVSSFVGVIYIV